MKKCIVNIRFFIRYTQLYKIFKLPGRKKFSSKCMLKLFEQIHNITIKIGSVLIFMKK